MPDLTPHVVSFISLMVGDRPMWQWTCLCTAGGKKPYHLKSNAVMDADQHMKDHGYE